MLLSSRLANIIYNTSILIFFVIVHLNKVQQLNLNMTSTIVALVGFPSIETAFPFMDLSDGNYAILHAKHDSSIYHDPLSKCQDTSCQALLTRELNIRVYVFVQHMDHLIYSANVVKIVCAHCPLSKKDMALILDTNNNTFEFKKMKSIN